MLVPERPEVVRIEVSTLCNARCVCCHLSPRVPRKLMDWPTFEKALDFVRPDARVDLYGLGEPTVHPALVDMVAAVTKRGGRAHISTNGILLDAFLRDRLYEAGLRLATFSIYAADARLHEALQGVPRSDAVWDNYAGSVARGFETAVIAVLMTTSLPDLPNLVRRVASCGGRWLVLQQLAVWPASPVEHVSPVSEWHLPMARHWIAEARKEAERVGVHVERCYPPILQ